MTWVFPVELGRVEVWSINRASQSGEEHVVWACLGRPVNPSIQMKKEDLFQIAPFSIDRTY